MKDAINTFDGFVKGSGNGDIGYDGKGETAVVALEVVAVCLADLVGGGLASDGTTDFVAFLEETVEDVGCHEPRGTSNEDELRALGLAGAGELADLLGGFVDDRRHVGEDWKK